MKIAPPYYAHCAVFAFRRIALLALYFETSIIKLVSVYLNSGSDLGDPTAGVMGSDHFTQEEIDRIRRWEFHGLDDALRLMRKTRPGPKLVGRWDWHFWMFLVTTCLPCFGVYCLVMWVRAGLWKKHEKRLAIEKQKAALSSKTTPSHVQISVLEQEIQRLKILLLTNGKGLPKLSPESWQRIFDSGKVEKAEPSEKSPASNSDGQNKLKFSERVWNSVKRWLPFYVEPYFTKRQGPPPKTDFRAIMKDASDDY